MAHGELGPMMTPEEAPNGAVVQIGHPANKARAVKVGGVFVSIDTGAPLSFDDIHKTAWIPEAKVFEGVVSDISYEDSGSAAVAGVDSGQFEGPFVVLHSWFEPIGLGRAIHDKHWWLQSVEGKRVRITVEVIP